MAAALDLWRLPNQWLREEIGHDPNGSLTSAQVAQWLEENKDEVPEELLQRDRTKVIAYICSTYWRLKRIARDKETKAGLTCITKDSSDDEPLAKRLATDMKREDKKKGQKPVQKPSVDAIDAWLSERVERDKSRISKTEIEEWLTENKSKLPQSFLSKELSQQRQYCYGVFARKGGERPSRKHRKRAQAAKPVGNGDPQGLVRHTSDFGVGPSCSLVREDKILPSQPNPEGAEGDGMEPEPKRQKEAPGPSMPGFQTNSQLYTEWTFTGTSSGHFRFTGDSSAAPPNSADFAAALKKHTEQLGAMVASVKGWTVKLVCKGSPRAREGAYVARFRYKKKDFMPKLEKVEEFLRRHPNLRKGAATRDDLHGAQGALDTAENKSKPSAFPGRLPNAQEVKGTGKDRPRTGKKDVLGELLHTWTLLTDLELRLEEHINRVERTKGRVSFSDAVENADQKRLQWQFSEAMLDGRDTSNQCPDTLDKNGARLLHQREAGLPNGPRGLWSKRPAGGGLQWTSVARGWTSRVRAWQGLACTSLRSEFATWRPTSHAWTSHALTQATAPPQELQGGQKVLDIRLHPKGAPLLVVGCNISPNELIVYDLLTGQAKSLQGHNSFIQAVEFTSTGDRIVSCGKDTLRVWDSATGGAIHSIGPDTGAGGEAEVTGHRDKIGCMATNPFNLKLAATSGSKDKRLLLWDVESGKLAADLNQEHRLGGDAPAVDTMVFSSKSLLLCGEDSEEHSPAMVSLWDVEQQKRLLTLPAHDKYVVTCQVSSRGDTYITGAGDGCAALWDVRDRSARGIVRIKLGDDCEVTSVSFSPCDTYFQASCTTNRTLIFDRRYMSLERRAEKPPPPGRPLMVKSCAAERYRPVHCLSHGEPMPTRTEEQREQAGVLAGYVDDGDQGVNHAHWFHHGTNLVTASGNGSVTIWDVSLGVPCLKTFETAHAGSCNAVAVSLDDRTICSGGDDQKLTLYQDIRNGLHPWRLTALAFA